jgi:hypothetical protein
MQSKLSTQHFAVRHQLGGMDCNSICLPAIELLPCAPLIRFVIQDFRSYYPLAFQTQDTSIDDASD